MHKYEYIYIVKLSFGNNQAHISPYRSPFYITNDGDWFMHYMVTYGSFKINIFDTTAVRRLQTPLKSNWSNGEGNINIFPGPYTKEKLNIPYFS